MSAMFAKPNSRPEDRTFPTTAVAIAAVAVVILVAVLVLLGRRHGPAFDPSKPQPAAAYATNLEVTDLKMSQSDTMAGGKVLYLDGHVTNKGPQTVNGITVQVLFGNDANMPPEVKTEDMQIIRMREPEVDAVPVSMAPLAPGAGADFRLIVENVYDNWNQQLPKLTAIVVGTK
ncbi:MAG: DUF2393 family protein [Acidobacteriaceae bacterium]|nr:DUF2393 family protein [Acidobacteriaceae bacterium]